MTDDARRAYRHIIRPTLERLGAIRPAFGAPISAQLVAAIGLQESELRETKQLRQNGTPREDLGRSWWQYESGEAAAIAGILRHPSTQWAREVIGSMGYPLEWRELWWAAAYDQRLACVLARALLWTDPQPLPNDESGAWSLYLRTWRPGKPRKDRWAANWNRAGEIMDVMAVPSQPPHH